jgi:carbonic anhydrase/acetyltransferase-like protein (isoleucine patch superfamily)
VEVPLTPLEFMRRARRLYGGREAVVDGAILGRHCHVGRAAQVTGGTVLGDKSVVTDCSKL